MAGHDDLPLADDDHLPLGALRYRVRDSPKSGCGSRWSTSAPTPTAFRSSRWSRRACAGWRRRHPLAR
ncbi:hypothetical protein ADL28_25815 [Streptomyces violaceusniger]|uniref:Uncharacterized protein n=2 Tax=Streptomyces violaceusniger group TaxID=2839105 RepID=A0ABD5J0M7_9ACTN|nr:MULTISPECIES: hypothetical protein [Streptomyces]KUL50676.1 hypothetical protein ADL28_25815 [Streptomyces violaceusniger]MEE4581915.1 hypothetical protein [Streptomyces sp. DSM 41602]